MTILVFIVAILVYMFVCFVGVRFYFYLIGKSKMKLKNSVSQTVSRYILLGAFVITEIPFAIFFPAWISEKLMIIERTPVSTMAFILFGCFVLAFSVWNQWNQWGHPLAPPCQQAERK